VDMALYLLVVLLK